MRLKTAAAWVFLGLFIASGLGGFGILSRSLPESTLQIFDEQDAVGPDGETSLSDTGTLTGTIDPILVEQAGYIQSENISARTDTGVNTTYNLDIDSANNWIGSVAEIDVWDLKKLYLVNGTFDDGIPGSNQDPGGSVSKYPYGWDATSNDGGSGMTQFAEYVNQGQTFVTTENQGQDLIIPSNTYRHHATTFTVWYQTITNDPFTTDFKLNLDYLYYRGPIDKPGGDSVSGDVVMFVQFAGITVWTQSLKSLDGRGVWYNTGDILLTGMSVGASFTFFVGIYFVNTITLSAASDYDNDGAADGIANAASISVQFDNIELSGQTEPDLGQVDLQFVADGTSVPITGTAGEGSASVENPSLWTSGPVPIEITSNDTVSFQYQTRLLSHRFINSSPTTDTGSEGVSYSVDANQNPHLDLFTYVGTVDPYEQFTVNIIFPPDWENVTVQDPFQNDVTSQCSVTLNSFSIPTSLVSRLGWWQVSFDSPNYALDIDTQVYNPVSTNWEDASEFRTGNRTRVTASIGTATVTPSLDDNTQVSWILPSGTLWSADVVPNGAAGQITSSGRTFGPTNTSAGEWAVSIFWTNGTELAYGKADFALIHRAELVPVEASLEVESGVVFSNFMTYRDADNGELILDDIAAIVANWSTEQIFFTPDLFRNWYEADFDSDLVAAGRVHVVKVDASRPYYDDVSSTFTVIVQAITTLQILNIGELPVERGLDESFPVHFRYEQTSGTGVPGATLEISYTSTFIGLEEGTFQDYGNGTYTMFLKANVSDTYSIAFAASKSYHLEAQDSFTIIVEEIATDLIRINGTADAIRFGDSYRLLLHYQNSSAVGLDGATVELVSATPSVGIDWTITPTGDLGVYEVLLEPEKADVFTLVFSASLLNHETQFTTFTLMVSEIATTLTASPPLVSIAFDQNCTVNLYFQDEFLNPLANASVEIVDLPPELSIAAVLDWNNGTYTLIIDPLDQGSFDLLIRLSLENYQTATEAISLFVNPIPTSVQLEGGISSLTIDYGEPYSLVVYYNRTDLGTEVVGANITITGAPEGALVYRYEEYLGYYLVAIRGLEIGKWLVEVNANRTGHRSGTELLLLEIAEVDTVLQGSLPGTLIYGRSAYVNFSYLIEGNSTRIRSADIVRLGEASDWVDSYELNSGIYTLEIVPQSLGYHEVALRFERYGFETRSFTLSFTVDPVPIEVVFVEGLSGLEGSTITLSVRVREVGTSLPVSGAFVVYSLLNPDGIELDLGVMNESVSDPGFYSAALVAPRSGVQYTLSILVDIDNYELEGSSNLAALTPQTNFGLLFVRTVNENLILFLAAGVVGMVLLGTRIQAGRRARENMEALATKRRFDDARNILGVIVLHKESGLSVYSRILRAGIDESIVAAFITAIRNFRMEFDIESGSEEDQILPISDIIRVITTENLVIAFIMLNRPSREQRTRMVTFSRKIGMVFDEEFEATPVEIMDTGTAQSLDNLFDEVMDGILLRNYRLRESVELPKEEDCISDVLAETGTEVFRLDRLANALATCGMEEARAYKTVMEALEKDLLVITDEKIPTDENLFVADVESLLLAEKGLSEGISSSEDDLEDAE